MLRTLKGNGVSFTGSAITGGVGGEGAAQAAKLTSVATATSFKISDLLCIGILQGLLRLGVLGGQQRLFLGVLTRRLLTGYSLIACRLPGFREIGPQARHANLLPAGQGDERHDGDVAPVHAKLPPTRS